MHIWIDLDVGENEKPNATIEAVFTQPSAEFCRNFAICMLRDQHRILCISFLYHVHVMLDRHVLVFFSSVRNLLELALQNHGSLYRICLHNE